MCQARTSRQDSLIMEKNWHHYFPFEKPREQQRIAIDAGITALREKKFFVLQAGTGVGKSAIGLTVAKFINNELSNNEDYSNGANFLTTQKVLQKQYVKDFSREGMVSIESSANFNCRHHKQNTCAQSMRVLKTATKGSRFWNTCVFKCPYKNAKREFIDSEIGITNFPYFLAETNYARKILPKNILVIDEAHNAADELGKFIEIAITEKFSKDFLKISMPEMSTHKKAIDWINQEYFPKLVQKFQHMEKTLDDLNLSSKLSEFESLARQFELIDKHLCKLRRFLEVHSRDNWTFTNVEAFGKKSRRIEFKPIDVAPFSENMLFSYGRKVILMSATILDKQKFCEMLGIPMDDCEFISIESPFETKKRPILYFPVGKMGYKDIDSTLPKLKEAVEKIIENHKGEKGIVHCHTFKIANYLNENVRSNRTLIHDSSNRELILKRHINSKKASVLLSPSMTEGIDLVGQASRFQIICKIPFPYLGDQLVKKRMNKWDWWYPMQTVKTIIQSVGRSVRNENDYAVTYILDGGWDYFYAKHRRLFPEDFNSCMM